MAIHFLDQTQACTECQAGLMHLKRITYFTWLADELITVQDFPAWVCDLCGKREYDPQRVNQLNLLLTPNAGRPASAMTPRPRLIYNGKNQRAATE